MVSPQHARVVLTQIITICNLAFTPEEPKIYPLLNAVFEQLPLFLTTHADHFDELTLWRSLASLSFDMHPSKLKRPKRLQLEKLDFKNCHSVVMELCTAKS